MSRRLAVFLFLCSCSPVGLDGPDWRDPKAGEGPCFEVDLSDGIGDGEEIRTIFACLNEHDAFEELEPMVDYLTTSSLVDSFVKTLGATFDTFDVPELVRTATRLVTAEDAPLSGALGVYTEVYDDELLPPLLSVGQVAAGEVVRCEGDLLPEQCSVPAITQRLLATNAIDLAGNVLDELSTIEGDPLAPTLLETVADLILEMSPRSNPARISNPLLGLGEFLLDEEVEGGAPIDRLLTVLTPLLDNDAFIEDLTAELSRFALDGTLNALPSDVEILFTRDVDGVEVGFEGESIVDSLLDTLGSFDLALLEEEIALPGSDPVTILELALDLADDLYAEQADVGEIVAELEDVTDLLCGGSASNGICDLADDMLPPIIAAVEQTEAVPDLILPLVHVLRQHTDLLELVGFLEEVIAWDLLGKAEPLLRFSVEKDLLTPLLDVVPVFLQAELGRLRPVAHDAIELIRLVLHPIEDGGPEVVPVEVLLPIGRVMLDPPTPDADLDRILYEVAIRMHDPDSALSIDRLGELIDGLFTAIDAGEIDLVALLTDVLDNRDLWLGGAELLADDTLIALLRPDLQGGDAPWWLYDLIDRGVVDRILNFLAGILEGLIDLGLVDP